MKRHTEKSVKGTHITASTRSKERRPFADAKVASGTSKVNPNGTPRRRRRSVDAWHAMSQHVREPPKVLVQGQDNAITAGGP